MGAHFDKGQAPLTSLTNMTAHPFGPADLVIFDFDGVIADSEVISLSSLQVALNDFGVDLDLSEMQHRFLGKSINQIEAEAHTLNPDAKWEGFHTHWHAILFKRFETELAPIPGVIDLLDRLEALHLPYCIASGGSLERISLALRVMGMTSRFGHFFSSEQVKRGKPAPDLFLHAAKTLGAEPERCLVIEDSPFGIQAGRSAGMHTIGFLGGAHLQGSQESHRQLLLAQGAHGVVSELREIEF